MNQIELGDSFRPVQSDAGNKALPKRRGYFFYIFIIVMAVIVSALLSALYLNYATYRYTVTMMVTPVQNSPQRLPGGLESVANAVGLSLPSSADSGAFQLYLDGLLSRDAADELAKDQSIMHQTFSDEWSEETQSWRDPNTLKARVGDYLKGLLGIPITPWGPPSGSDLQEFLARNVTISRTRTSPVVRVSLQTANRELGQQIVMALHRSVDKKLRERTLQRTNQYILYLKKEFASIAITEYREALLEGLVEQEKSRMMASSDVWFVAEPFGEPVASARPTSPKALPVFAIALVASLLLAGILIWCCDPRLRASFR